VRGFIWCFWLLVAAVPFGLAGIWLGNEALMATAGGAVATVVFGWPVLVCMGALERDRTPGRGH
jgi:hypothetical protein